MCICAYNQNTVDTQIYLKRVAVIEKEMDALLESRMKELSANDMEVWVFDTKRNSHVQKGRLEQEQAARKKEESILDDNCRLGSHEKNIFVTRRRQNMIGMECFLTSQQSSIAACPQRSFLFVRANGA